MARIPTPTEAFAHSVCRQSFLSLWSYASPQGRTPGKELCDILVVCDPDIIIFSVKEVKPKVHAFGHIHGSYGQQKIGKTIFVNASLCSETYKPTNPPIVVDLE